MLIVFLSNLWIMSLKLTGTYEDDNIWYLASRLSDGRNINIIAFILMIVFYTSILPLLLSIFSFFRKNHWGFMIAVVYFLVYETTWIVFQSSFNYLSIFALILVIINIVFVVCMSILLIIRKKILAFSKDLQKIERDLKLSATKIPLSILIIDVISILVFLTTFFIPVYIREESGSLYYAIIIKVLFSGDINLEIIIYFLVNFAIFLSIFLYFANTLSNYFFEKERFIKKSEKLITYIFVATLIFFLIGLIMVMYHTYWGGIAQTFAYIPMLLMCLVIFTYAIFKGKFNAYNQVIFKEIQVKYAKVEPLLYVLLLTAVTVLMLLLPIIKIDIASGAYTNFINLTGIDILSDYANLDQGYRIVAFILVVMLISSGLCLVVTLTSYLSKDKQFNSVVKLATAVNVFFVFIIAISGYYFQIASEINQVVILDIFDFYGINLPALDFEFTISTDAIYALLASVSILVMMFIRKAFDREDMNVLDSNLLSLNSASDSSGDASSGITGEETFQEFDPCPAFTELDSKLDYFNQDIEKRKTLKTGETTLNKLIHFVVEYARNSRLHLSYTPEDIATFVAGMGASKLSILQGMSGTGKTSLPKIFSEAIFGNCDIIEVESSWKDKNELLGYYNEFSMKYTPKKFTLALYKAALNREIFTFVLLDEMNLSRIEYYFSDFLSLMENEENQREIKLINIKLNRKDKEKEIEYLALDHGHTLKVPPNVWFIGTANRDESTFVISDKVYDRAHTVNFTKRAPKVRNYTNPISKQYYDYQTINELFIQAKQKGNFDAENSELIKSVEALLAPYNISFGNRILKQIEDFVNIYKECFSNEDVESEAIEKILLSKVVAKLEVKTIDDKEKLEMEFEKLNLKQCSAFIKRLDNE
jgi:MoxR-like ATPase